MLTFKEIKELEQHINFYKKDENLIRFIHLAHLIDPKNDDSVLRLKDLIVLGINADLVKKEEK